jgi:hypothetical protein
MCWNVYVEYAPNAFEYKRIKQILDVLNNDCYNPARLAREQVGRSLLRLRVKERKVRTLQGSEPANGGASAPDVIETGWIISSQLIAMARATTSATEKRPANGQPLLFG